jgi:hypothetical protein
MACFGAAESSIVVSFTVERSLDSVCAHLRLLGGVILVVFQQPAQPFATPNRALTRWGEARRSLGASARPALPPRIVQTQALASLVILRTGFRRLITAFQEMYRLLQRRFEEVQQLAVDLHQTTVRLAALVVSE